MRAHGYEGIFDVIWMCPSSNLRSYNNLATRDNLWSLYFFENFVESIDVLKIVNYRKQNARILYFSSGKTEMYLISILLHLVNYREI